MKHKTWVLIGEILYWLLLPAIWIYAATTKPRARVLLTCGDEVLVVKNWLGAGAWALPGGGIEAGEDAAAAAVREVREELGIVLDTGALRSLGRRSVVESGGLKSKFYLFVVELPSKPELSLAKAEITAVAWIPAEALLGAGKSVGSTVKQSVTAWSEAKNLIS